MKKTVIKTNRAPIPAARYSQAICVGNTLYIHGVLPLDPQTGKSVAGGIEVQAERVFENMKGIVEAAGMTMGDIVKIGAFLDNLEAFPKFNEVYSRYFTADPPPARTTVQAKIPLGCLLEVEAVAVQTE